MDEARRFLRYVVPTLVFVVELGLVIFTTHPEYLKSAFEWLQPSGAGFAALLLVLAGGLGYVFSLVHHTLFWHVRRYGLDYSAFLQDAVDRDWLRLVPYGKKDDGSGKKITCREKHREAFNAIAFLWYQPGSDGDAKAPGMGQALISRADGISDLMHSLGTSVVAVCGVPVTWLVLFLFFSLGPSSRPGVWGYVVGFVLVGVLIWLHWSNYKRTRNFLVQLVKNALATHFAGVKRPTEIYVDRPQGFEKVIKQDFPANEA
jgi:hypothetical protein